MQVRFRFYTGINASGTKVGNTETRTTTGCSTRGYNFIKDGSDYVGGIKSVLVELCWENDGWWCPEDYIYNR